MFELPQETPTVTARRLESHGRKGNTVDNQTRGTEEKQHCYVRQIWMCPTVGVYWTFNLDLEIFIS
jgi:hypothetical protein